MWKKCQGWENNGGNWHGRKRSKVWEIRWRKIKGRGVQEIEVAWLLLANLIVWSTVRSKAMIENEDLDKILQSWTNGGSIWRTYVYNDMTRSGIEKENRGETITSTNLESVYVI